MAKKARKRKGKFYGKFKTPQEVQLFKQYIINRYDRTPYEKRSIQHIVEDLQEKGFDITYPTVYNWLKNSEVKIVKNVKRNEEKKIVNVGLTLDVDHLMEGFRDHMSRSFLIEQAINMLFGLSMENLMVILFPEGNVLLTKTKAKLLALTTNNLKPVDLHFLQGMVTLAEESDDWQGFVKKYLKASGVSYYPL
jgi:hypothetical protein